MSIRQIVRRSLPLCLAASLGLAFPLVGQPAPSNILDEMGPAPEEAVQATPTPVPTPTAPPDPWAIRVKEFQVYQTHNEGLDHLVRALQLFDLRAYFPFAPAVDDILENGWRASNPPLAGMIQIQGPAMEALLACALADAPLFPPPKGPSDPQPNFPALHGLGKVLLAQANGFQAGGRHDDATRSTLAALRLGAYLRCENAPFTQHVVGVAITRNAMTTLHRLVRDQRLTEDHLKAIGSELHKLDREWPNLAVQVGNEGTAMMARMRLLATDAGEREKVIATLPAGLTPRRQFLDSIRLFTENEPEVRQLWSDLFRQVQKPTHERSAEEWARLVAAGQRFEMPMASFQDAVLRDDLSRANLRLAMAYLAIRLDKRDVAAATVDPFSGQPLRLTPDRIYSVGPDGVDDRGGKRYDPTTGPTGTGDVTLMLR
ncbi:MAG: hypothetical protein KF858_08005 [Candidatus Sumerlaeia bacterium]|nr:hypothetical protein [Candidatus Sumerlaeia bacterium]